MGAAAACRSAILLLAAATAAASGATGPLPGEIVVTAARQSQPQIELIGNTSRLDAARIDLLRATHPAEFGTQAAGVWLERGAQQESLPAIRSPVLTGPGSCGAFLMLEDGIPLRPAGFCNVNQLFESLSEQAVATEVVRGPASAAWGANGLHGTLNILLPAARGPAETRASLERGPHDYWRGMARWRGQLANNPAVAGLVYSHDGDFRADAGYDQAKGFIKWGHDSAAGALELGLAATWLDQDSAGFVTGHRAYADRRLRRQNQNPEGYRKASSQRLSLHFLPTAGQPLSGSELRAWMQRSEMDFLQHFMPGKPDEQNGQWNTGLMFTQQAVFKGGQSLVSGFDLELARGYLKETQAGDSGLGNLSAGKHYDYTASSLRSALFAQLRWPLAEAWTAETGLRAEIMRYDYTNRMLDGNTRDDGSACTPAPCRHSRPSERRDDFFNMAPNLGLLWQPLSDFSAYARLSRGFRPPQAAELYRLQSQQSVADLESETLDSGELGLHWETGILRLEAVAYAMKKRHVIFQDASRFNIGDGRTRHRGVELQGSFRLPSGPYGGIAASRARHSYAFSATTPGGEQIRSGTDIDTAPRTLGSAHLGIAKGALQAELEWVHVGSYALDAGNLTRYGGHDLFNLRGRWQLLPEWALALRLNNLGNRLYAERADFVSLPAPAWRYFPGRERELHLELSWARH